MTPEYAEGLDDVLQEVRGKLTGILNGLDIVNFHPSKDKIIKRKFSVDSFSREREANKKELQKIFDLPQDVRKPLVAISGRLAKQKGWDFIIEVLTHLLIEPPEVQVVVLGSGDERYRLELTVLQKNFPEQIGLYLRPDFKLPRKIFAGADVILMPSLFEPGGIVALEALRYGCVPIVRRTGGLNDIITDFNPETKKGNGFSFKSKDSWALYGTIIEALTIYKYPKLWRLLVKNCMESDFSWNHAAAEYDTWYKNTIRDRKEHLPEVERSLFAIDRNLELRIKN
jgi:starch synthase